MALKTGGRPSILTGAPLFRLRRLAAPAPAPTACEQTHAGLSRAAGRIPTRCAAAAATRRIPLPGQVGALMNRPTRGPATSGKQTERAASRLILRIKFVLPRAYLAAAVPGGASIICAPRSGDTRGKRSETIRRESCGANLKWASEQLARNACGRLLFARKSCASSCSDRLALAAASKPSRRRRRRPLPACRHFRKQRPRAKQSLAAYRQIRSLSLSLCCFGQANLQRDALAVITRLCLRT